MIQNTKISVTLTPELRLNRALKQAGIETPETITHLSVSGTLTEGDLQYIRNKMSKNLQILDISKTSMKTEKFSAWGCSSLISIVFPDSVIKFGHSAFYDCSRLTSINIPNSVEEIASNAFDGCTRLTSITVHPDNPFFSSKYGVLYNKNKTAIIKYPNGRKGTSGSFKIPNSVVKIERSAFEGCVGLTSIIIPDSVLKIERSAFEGCVGLTSIIIPDSVTYIVIDAFKGCKGLKHITIPDSVTEIGCFAFSGCSGLKSVIIPNSVVKIGLKHLHVVLV